MMTEKSRTKEKHPLHSAVHGHSRTMFPTELTLQAKVSTYLPQSVCFPSPSPIFCAPVPNDRQMDPNDSSSSNSSSREAVRTPPDTSRTAPHWPASDPTGVPLKAALKKKFRPATDPHILKLEMSRLDKHLSPRVTREKRRCLSEGRCLECVQTP